MNKNIKRIVWGIIILALFFYSEYGLKIGWKYSIGTALTASFVLMLGFHFLVKLKNKNNPKSEENSYVLPDGMAKIMKIIDMRTQYEASIMAMFFMMIGMIAFTIYILFFADLSGFMKFFIVFNSFWGMVFMGASLVTNFQSYNYYMQSQKAIEQSDFFSLPQSPSKQNIQAQVSINSLKGGNKI